MNIEKVETQSLLPEGILAKIAVVQMWPELKTAEDEVIARIKNTCDLIGVEMFIIDTAGCRIDYPHNEITTSDVDFVIHLHFETPKTYDAFSLVTLWNPLDFYHEWGYRRYSSHLMTHDDFLSCGSTSADDHVKRMMERSSTHLAPSFNLFHSLPRPFYEPDLGELKLFYVGINWEKIGKGVGRHDDLLKSLDSTGELVIYGPKIFQGIDVWEGYASYAGSIPFDGTSIIKAIHKAGIALVLSSDAHKKAELMSSRLFEGLAAGAVIIVDENAFAYEHFGDSLLYIKTQNVDAEDITNQVRKHLDWISDNREEAIQLACKAQRIFIDKFDMCAALSTIYSGLSKRKDELNQLYLSQKKSYQVTIFGVLLKYDEEKFKHLIAVFKGQSYTAKKIIIIVDTVEYNLFASAIEDIIGSNVGVTICKVECFKRDSKNRIVTQNKLGELLLTSLDSLADDELFSFLFPNETLFSDHYNALVRAFEDDSALELAHSDLLLTHYSNSKLHHDLIDTIIPFNYIHNHPNGYSRILFKMKREPWLASTFRYLGFGVIDALFIQTSIRMRVSRASCKIDIDNLPYDNHCDFTEDYEIIIDTLESEKRNTIWHERNVLLEIKGLKKEQSETALAPSKVKLNTLSIEERQEMIAHLLESLSLPRWLMFVIRKCHSLFGKN
jgi:hypothetical protein